MRLSYCCPMILAASVLCFSSGFASSAIAQSEPPYPARRLLYVVPTPPSGGADFPPRFIAERLSKNIGQPVVVENRPGAAGAIGTEFVARQPADGYTMLHVVFQHVILPNFQRNLSYDPIADFEAVSHVMSNVFVLTVNPSVGRSMKEVLTRAGANPGKFTYASVGNGSPHHLAATMFESLTGIKLLHVPYKGGAQIAQALVAGEVDMGFIALLAVGQFVQTGKLHALGLTSPKLKKLAPDIPTMAEAGVSGFDMDTWQGIVVRSGTPRAVISRLNREVVAILQDPAEAERLRKASYEPVGTTPEHFQGVLKADFTKWARLIKESGIKGD